MGDGHLNLKRKWNGCQVVNKQWCTIFGYRRLCSLGWRQSRSMCVHIRSSIVAVAMWAMHVS